MALALPRDIGGEAGAFPFPFPPRARPPILAGCARGGSSISTSLSEVPSDSGSGFLIVNAIGLLTGGSSSSSSVMLRSLLASCHRYPRLGPASSSESSVSSSGGGFPLLSVSIFTKASDSESVGGATGFRFLGAAALALPLARPLAPLPLTEAGSATSDSSSAIGDSAIGDTAGAFQDQHIGLGSPLGGEHARITTSGLQLSTQFPNFCFLRIQQFTKLDQ